MIMNFTQFYEAAREQLLHSNNAPPRELPGGALTFDNITSAAQHRPITMLDIRCDYLQQLKAIELAGDTSPGEVRQAYLSAYTTPIRVSCKDMMAAANNELALILQNKENLTGLFSDRLLAEHGVLNTVAIKLQDPNATQLFTYAQVKRFGFAIQQNRSPILLFTPTMQRFFRRGEQLLKVSYATFAESLLIAAGNVPLESKVRYTLNEYYDVEQLRLTQHERACIQNMQEPKEIGGEELTLFARQLQNDAGLQLSIVETQATGLLARSLYDSQSNTIYLKSQLSEQHRAWELTKRLSEAVICSTSSSPQIVQVFESRLMAIELAHKWAVRPAGSFADEATAAFADAQPEMVGTLEDVTCKVSHAARFVSHQLDTVIKEQQPTAREKAHNRQQEATLQQGQSEQLENFMQGIQ
ncbi:MAG: hypothetical protein RSF82_10055 [Angelakisella sp.]